MRFPIDHSLIPLPQGTKAETKKKIVKPKIEVLSKNELRRIVMTKFQKKQSSSKKSNKSLNVRKFKKFLNAKQFTCIICLELMICPTTLQCGHSFCLPCIQKLNGSALKYICSLCRSSNINSHYQVDKKIQKLVKIIHTFKLTSTEQQQYTSRAIQVKHQLKQRGIQRQLHINQQIKIRIQNTWRRAKVISIMKKQNKALYQIQSITTDQCFHIIHDSVNIRLLNEEQIASMKGQNGQYFSFDIFLQQQFPVRSAHANSNENWQDLLLQVNYYEEQHYSIPSNDISFQQLPNHVQSSSIQDQTAMPSLIQFISIDTI